MIISADRNIRRVLLVSPPYRVAKEQQFYYMPPLGLLYLAALLRNDYEVKVLDAAIERPDNIENLDAGFVYSGLSYKDIRKRIEEFAPDVVGVSCLFSPEWPVVNNIVSLTKEINKNIYTVVGGNHPTFTAEDCLQNKDIDFIVMGEGEYTFRELLETLGDNKTACLEKIKGIAYKNGVGLKVSPERQVIENLDEIPFPARDMTPMSKYTTMNSFQGQFSSKKKNIATMITSRGCPHECIFCNSKKYWVRYRARSHENVLDEIELLLNSYNVGEIQFLDDNITLNRNRAERIFKGIIDRRLNFRWCLPQGVELNTLDEKMIALMAESGCYEVCLPFESGNQEVVTNIIKKPLNLEKASRLVKYFNKYGISTQGSFIMGLPGETVDNMEDTYRLAKRLNLVNSAFSVANVLPGTELEQIVIERNLGGKLDYVNNSYSRMQYSTSDWSPDTVEKLALKYFIKMQFLSFLHHPAKLWQFLGNPGRVASVLKRVFLKLFAKL